MKQYGLNSIRNTVLLSHGGAGKTQISEAMLYTAKAINRLGKVDEGSTSSDYDPDEIKRGISISLSLLPCEWRDAKINVLDAPGYADFVGEMKAGIRVSEAAIIVICAASGVEVGTEQVWGYCDEAELPRMIFVNKMDRENADFFRTLEDIQARFGKSCVPLQVPVGAHSSFKGIVDLLTMKAYMDGKEAEIPEEVRSRVDSLREQLVEGVAETNDALIEKYLGGEELTDEEIRENLRKAIVEGKTVPVLAGSALNNVSIDRLLDAIHDYLPRPDEARVQFEDGESAPDEEAPLAALVFKTTADPYVGKLTYFRVYNGVMESNSQVWNSTQGAAERVGQLFMLRGKNQETLQQVRAGDIGAVAKLGVTNTGDTLCRQDRQVKIVPISFPEPVLSMAVYPKGKGDVDKMGPALTRLVEEDPTLRMYRDADTGETILSGIGDTQLEVAGDKLARKFGVNVELHVPKVPYRETIMSSTNAEYKHKKQSGGHGQYGHVLLELEPLPRGTGNEFAEKVVGGAVPKNYFPAVEKGVLEAEHEGVLARFPVVDVKVTLYDGSFHPVDSSEMAFKIASSQALKKGLSQATPVLIEPIMNLRVTVPSDLTGDIMGDLNTKRARVQGMTPDGNYNIIEAQVPLAEVQRYAIDLKSMTQGRGSYTLEFSHYEEVPGNITQKIVAERQAEKEAEKA